MVEGVFARAFRSTLRPIELGRKLVREMEDHRTLDVKGRTVVPNSFAFRLNPSDHEQFAEIHTELIRELCDAARDYARDESYVFLGPVTVVVEPDSAQKSGRFAVTSKLVEAPGGRSAAALTGPNGQRFELTDRPLTIGRLPGSTIELADTNVSRRHAEVRASGDGFVIVDLGSTNGTRVNGVAISERRLTNGDEITIGASRLRFEGP